MASLQPVPAQLVQGGEVQWATPCKFAVEWSDHPMLLVPQEQEWLLATLLPGIPCPGFFFHILWLLAQLSPPQGESSHS